MKVVIDIPEILLDRIKSAKCVPDMYGSDIVNTVVCVRDGMPYEERPHGEWHTTPNPNYSPFDSTSEVIYRCSKCAYSSGYRITAKWNFCPNCGTPMKKEGDNK